MDIDIKRSKVKEFDFLKILYIEIKVVFIYLGFPRPLFFFEFSLKMDFQILSLNTLTFKKKMLTLISGKYGSGNLENTFI